MIVALRNPEETLDALRLLLKEEIATVKQQYQGPANRERDQQSASAQPPHSTAQKDVSNRKGEAQKKAKAGKPGEHRDK